MHASISFSLSALLALSTLPNPSDARSWSLKPWARGRDHSKLINERKVMGTRTVTVKATRTKTIWVGAETATVETSTTGPVEGSTSTGSMVNTILPTSTQEATEQASSTASSSSMESASGSSTAWQTESVEVIGTGSFSSWASEATMTASTSASSSTTADDDEETNSTAQTSEATATETASSSASVEVSASESSSSATTEIVAPVPTSTGDEGSSATEAIPTTSELRSSTETAGPASTALPPNLVLNPTSISVDLSGSTGSISTSNTASSSFALPEPTELASTVGQESQKLTMPLASGTDSSSSPSQSTVSSIESEAASSATAVPSSSLAYQPGWNAPGAIPSYPPFVSASQSSVAEATVTVSSVSTNSSTAAAASQSAYVPNGQAPGAIPAYPSFVRSSSSSMAQASMTESSSSTNSGSAAPSATRSAYTPNGQAPGAIPAYPSFISSSRSSSVEASRTDTSAIASATSTDATATQTQSQSTETAFESATESASTASSWWSSWFSASSAASETASASTTAASETVSVSATETETATISITASSSDVASASASSTSAPNPIATGRTGLSTTPLASKMTAGYYPDWTVWTYPVSALDWSKLDVVDFAFAIPDVNFQLQFLQYNSLDTLRELVSAGHAAGKKVRLSIGGWTGSVYFSAAVSNDQNRQTFANNIATVYRDYNLDGIDLDWEYPGGGGAWGNGQDSNDTTNYLTFFKVLRKTLPPQALISSATQVTPFRSSSGVPSIDISGFAQVLDWITIMNYDIWSSNNDNPGPNAPLSLGCGKSEMDWANAEAAVTAWNKAGMPSNQIMLGIAAYGYLQMSSASRLRTRRRDLDVRAMVTVRNPNGDSDKGQINFASLIDQGALKRDPATGNWIGDNGFTREWDDCSSTPWLKSPYSGQLITYDDPQSISMKAQYARQAGLRGTSVWEITGDMGGSNWSLLTAARSGLGI